MVLAVFRSRLRSENAEEFETLAVRMLELAEDGERVSLIEFESAEHLHARISVRTLTDR